MNCMENSQRYRSFAFGEFFEIKRDRKTRKKCDDDDEMFDEFIRVFFACKLQRLVNRRRIYHIKIHPFTHLISSSSSSSCSQNTRNRKREIEREREKENERDFKSSLAKTAKRSFSNYVLIYTGDKFKSTGNVIKINENKL